jgi:hypothetical protein
MKYYAVTALLTMVISTFASPASAGTDLENILSKGGQKLTQQQMLDTFLGNTITLKKNGLKKFFESDSKAIIYVKGKELSQKSWFSDDNQMCQISIRSGQKLCLDVVKVSDSNYHLYKPNGDLDFEFTVSSGAPK